MAIHQAQMIQDPRSSIQQILEENERLKRELDQALEAQKEMQDERQQSKELIKKLKPYMDIIENSEGQTHMQIYLRNPGLITMLKLKTRKLFGEHINVDSDISTIAKESRAKVDVVVEAMVALCVQGFWPHVVNHIRKTYDAG